MDRGLLPENVRFPDGRLEAFEPERITRSLFNVAERIGMADPFLARELTEGVLHFLSVDREGPFITDEEIAEITEKIVRELGHPILARAYRDRAVPMRSKEPGSPKIWPGWLQSDHATIRIRQKAADESLERFSLSEVYPAELASAHREGLVRIFGLASPFELAGIAANLPIDHLLESLRELGNIAGEFIAVDSPEYELATAHGEPDQLAKCYLEQVGPAAEAMGIELLMNLNIASPPPRLAEGAGPLFKVDGDHSHARRDAIAKAFAGSCNYANVRVWWHQTDSADSPASSNVKLVLDRARSPIHLGPGLDRQTPATLVRVGVNLPRLVEMLGGAPVSSELFLKKLGSLTRFAKTAGHAKQDFLRKHGRAELKTGFLLERARLVFVPQGLQEVATMSELPPAEFARDIPRTMKVAAEQDRPRTLPIRIELEE